MKTIKLRSYHPWGTNAYAVDMFYRRDLIKTFEGHDYDALLATAKAWALIQGFTHYAHSGERGTL
jgi:hypothetical protein